MKTRALFAAMVLGGAVGCTDNVDSVTREYRATTNECIDALSMITTEAHAGRMIGRVLKPARDRFKAIDDKLVIVQSNREKPEMVKEMLESDGLHLYLTDLAVNRQRYGLEITRLRNLYKQYMDRERELLVAEGVADPKFNGRDVCPNLHEILYEPLLESLRRQLTQPDLLGLMKQFPAWKVKDYDALYEKHTKRREAFLPKKEIRLVW